MAEEAGTALRKLPGLDRDNLAFWTGGAEGLLMILRCARCGHYTHPPLPRCLNCGSEEVAPEPVSGRGRVKSFSVNHQPWVPGLAVPYVVAVVELVEQEQLYLFTNILNCPPEEVGSGMPVKVAFVQDGHVHLPMFEPDAAVE